MDAAAVAAMEPSADVSARTTAIFDRQIMSQRGQLDRIFGWVLLVQWIAGIFVALLYSPFGWEGKTQAVHLHLQLAVFLGGALCSLPVLLAWTRPGQVPTRHIIAVSQVLWSALLIHLTGGRIETHFHIFGSLAWLAFYLDWKVLITATVVVASDHFIRGMLYPESVYGIVNPEWWRFLEHAFWVVFEDVILIWACFNGLRSLREGAEREARMQDLNEINENKSAALELMIKEMQDKPA